MSSGLARRVQKKATFPLVIWYSSGFFLNTLVLFALAFFLLRSYLIEEDRSAVQLKLMELTSSYQAGGLSSLEKELEVERSFGKKNPFFIRLLDKSGNTVAQILPPSLGEDDVPPPERPAEGAAGFRSWPVDRGEEELELGSSLLDCGYLLQVGKKSSERDKVLRHFRRTLGVLIIPAPVFCIIGGWFLAYRSLLPIRHLTETVRAVYRGQTGQRVPVSKGGEGLEELTVLFNAMLERIEDLIRGLRESLDNVAHDIRTPLTRLRAMAELALGSEDNEEGLREALVECIEESDRILAMLNTLMDISEAETGTMRLELRHVSLNFLLGEILEFYQYAAEDKGISLEASCEGDLHLRADPNRIRQVLGNLLDNALKYTSPGGKITVRARLQEREVAISVSDSGIGIPEQDLPRIWERMYRCDHSRSQRGLGLGLSLVKAVVEAHGGRVEVLSTPGKGSTFTVYFPSPA
jgi:signal transduction histidine kinase